jgi:hypothetical protein
MTQLTCTAYVAYWHKADIPLLTQSGSHFCRFPIRACAHAAGLFCGNGRRDLGYKAGAALESYVAPQPSYGDYKTIPETN